MSRVITASVVVGRPSVGRYTRALRSEPDDEGAAAASDDDELDDLSDVERRYDTDGDAWYTKAEFVRYYGGSTAEWHAAAPRRVLDEDGDGDDASAVEALSPSPRSDARRGCVDQQAVCCCCWVCLPGSLLLVVSGFALSLKLNGDINDRFERGRPSNVLRDAGVLVHIWDRYENWRSNRPWELLSDPRYDHWSSSVINRQQPKLFPRGEPFAGGIIFSPLAPVLCGYAGDSGSGTAVKGGCDGGKGVRRTPLSLQAAMEGSLASKDFNEIIVDGRQAYAAQLPGVVQAFLVLTWQSTPGGFERTDHGAFAQAKGVRKEYLKSLGLSRRESRGHAPLLAYTFNPYLTPIVPETAFTVVDDE